LFNIHNASHDEYGSAIKRVLEFRHHGKFDLDRFKKMEDMFLGEKRVSEWDFDADQRHEDRKDRVVTHLRPLVHERRQNPNNYYNKNYALFTAKEDQDSNQARIAKIWGAYDRDFVYKTCKVEAIDYKLNQKDAIEIYGNPFEEDKIQKGMSNVVEGLDKNLLRGKIYQERDHIDTFKQHEHVEARQSAYEQKGKWDKEVREAEGLPSTKKIRTGISKQAKRHDFSYDDPATLYPSPVPNLGKHMRRNPKN